MKKERLQVLYLKALFFHGLFYRLHPFMTTVLQMDSVFYNIPKRLFFFFLAFPFLAFFSFSGWISRSMS